MTVRRHNGVRRCLEVSKNAGFTPHDVTEAYVYVINQAATVTEVAVSFGVTRLETVHRWLRRYAA